MKFFILLSFFLPSVNFCFGQSSKEQKFKTTVEKIILAFSKQDSLGVAKVVKKDIGINQLYRLGVYDNFKNLKSLSFSDSIGEKEFFRDTKGVKLLSLHYSKLPVYNCGKGWSKKGLFVDTTKVDHMLSQICKDRNNNRPDNIPSAKIQSFYKLENKSRRVVLYDTNGIELVFYVSYINADWYLTIIDNVTSDCSV